MIAVYEFLLSILPKISFSEASDDLAEAFPLFHDMSYNNILVDPTTTEIVDWIYVSL
jgi:hypothetical protein